MSGVITHEIEHFTDRLDRIIREQAGRRIFQHLDQIRRLSARRRHQDHRAGRPAKRALINRLSVREASQVTHAFSLFFQLTNLCEERARVRHLRAESAPARSLRSLFQELKEAGASAEQPQRCLDELEIQPVPAESIRRRKSSVDPLNDLQVRFLGRWRQAPMKERTESLRRLLALTVNGIAFRMKSAG